jgi:hypothetical protein
MLRRQRTRGKVSAGFDALLFFFAGVSSVWLAYLVLAESLRANWQVLLLIGFGLLVAYLVLPRFHRMLTNLYLPGYFIGRARTSDGLLADPVNIALLGDEPRLHTALANAGWTRADEVDLASSVRIIRTTLSRSSYPEAPVSPLRLFDRNQDFAYQQEVEGNPSKRHHVRFWRCPAGWRLPGGHPADWVAAGTYDRSVGLSLMTLQVTHRIAGDIDAERDHIVEGLLEHNPPAELDVIRHFSTGYHARNGGGDTMVTDGDMPVVDIRGLEPSAAARAILPTEVEDARPAPIVFGSGVAFARALFSLVVAVGVSTGIGWDWLPASAKADNSTATAIGLVVAAAIDAWLGTATLHGRNWARVLLMIGSVGAILTAYLATLDGGPRPTLGAGLPAVTLSILLLLALTSHRARDYTTRRRP